MTKKTTDKRRCAVLLAAGLLLSTAICARGSTTYLFNIPAGDLIASLERLGERAHMTVVYDKQLVAGKPRAALNGRMSVEAALAQLLSDTGLSWKYVNETTVVLKPKTDRISMAAGADRLADAAGSSKNNSPDEMTVKDNREKLQPFNTANLDLTRTDDDALPYTVFSAQDIQLSGAASLQEFLQNRLSQNFSSSLPEEMDGEGVSFTDRTTQVSMHGWGSEETVFLLNGRRMASQYQSIADDSLNSAPNLRGIPLASIEKIEILSSAGSAIYGVNATGGVINIITRQDYKGGGFFVNYETPADTSAPRRNVEFDYAAPLAAGLNVRLSAGYDESTPLHASDRADVTNLRWRQLVLARDRSRLLAPVAGRPLNTSSQRFGATPNIRASTTTGNLFTNLSGAPASNFTTVPTGYTGTGGLASFQPGVYNFEQAAGAAGSNAYARDSTLGASSTNITVALGADKNFGPHLRWSVDYRYAQNDAEGHPNGALTFSSATLTSNRPRVPGSAPANPFGQDVQVSLIDPRMQRPELLNTPTNITWELSSTLRADLGSWRGFVDFSRSQNTNRYAQNIFWEPYGGWRNAFLTGAYNPFVDLRAVAPAADSFYEHYIVQRTFSGSAARSTQLALKAAGPVFHLPAGDPQLLVGSEWSRSDRYRSYQYAQYQDNLTGEPQTPVGSASDVAAPLDNDPNRRFVLNDYAVFTEATVPLLGSAQRVPLIRQMELTASWRTSREVNEGFVSQSQGGKPTEYTTTSNVYAAGFRYEPFEGIALRATRSAGFRPPTMYEIGPFTPIEQGFAPDFLFPLNDPSRNEEILLPVTAWREGGNPGLKPETSVATNLGLIFAPAWTAGLRLSVDYVTIVRDDAISSFSLQQVIDLGDDLPGRVQRGAPDGNPSGLGPITFVDASKINLSQIKSKSLDFTLNYELPGVFGGRLVLAGAATKNLSFKLQATDSAPPVEQIRNLAAPFSQQVQWNANAQVRWEGRQWSYGWSARYYDYLLAALTDRTIQGSDRAPWKINHDANVSYRAAAVQNPHGLDWLLSDLAVSLGVKNVFDRKPRFWAANSEFGVAPYDSVLGRSVWLQMRKSL